MIAALSEVNTGQRVTVLTGYDQTDIMTTENGSGGPPRRLRHRIPVSLRQHWPLVAVFCAFVLVAATVFGSTRVRPYITGNASVIASDITENIAGTVDFFDAEQDHTVNLDFSQSDYDRMIAPTRTRARRSGSPPTSPSTAR